MERKTKERTKKKSLQDTRLIGKYYKLEIVSISMTFQQSGTFYLLITLLFLFLER